MATLASTTIVVCNHQAALVDSMETLAAMKAELDTLAAIKSEIEVRGLVTENCILASRGDDRGTGRSKRFEGRDIVM